MNTTTSSRGLLVIGIVLVSVFAGVVIPGAVAAQDTINGTTTDNGTTAANGTVAANGTTANVSLAANPTVAGTISNHTVNITIPDAVAGNLTAIDVNYSDANVSTRPVNAQVSSATIDDQTIPSSNFSLFATGFGEVGTNPTVTRVTFDMNRSLQPEARDRLTLLYGVQHPTEVGNHTVGVLLNPDTDAIELTTNLTITPNETTPAAGENGTTTGGVGNGTETTTEDGGMGVGNETGTTTEDDGAGGETETTTEEAGIGGETETTAADGGIGDETETTAADAGAGAGGETTTSGNGPGFTAFAGLVAVLAVALLATRRN